MNKDHIKTLTDEMQYDAANHGLDAKALRARLRYYRRKIIDAVKLIREGNND